ncbi:MAG: hypothetical protein IJR53_01110 [Bacteroidales bacterium]|nr:hypothetical protein [Bacteroidales bacterium]
MKIFVANKKNKIENVQRKYPFSTILDITSTSEYRGLRVLSPFYPHRNIPVPGMPNKKATCVEAVWQGLKVFKGCGVDYDTFQNDTMKNIKRSVRKYGKPLGHQYGDKLLNYEDARWLIYLPTYLYVLKTVPSVSRTIEKIKEELKKRDVVFLDYNTNCDLLDYTKPLSHAGLVKLYIEERYPLFSEKEQYISTQQSLMNKSIEDIIDAIKHNERYKEHIYSPYIKSIRECGISNWNEIAALSGEKCDGWKTLVNEIKEKDMVNKQLSLFD